MKRLEIFILPPLMAILAMCQGQMTELPRKPHIRRPLNFSVEELPNLPFNATSTLFQTSSQLLARKSSPRFTFEFATRTTTTILPPKIISLESTTNRASIRFVTNAQIVNATTTQSINTPPITEIPQIDSDTGRFEMIVRDEKLPTTHPAIIQSTTTQSTTIQLTTIENRRLQNSTIRPTDRTHHVNEKLPNGLRPQQKLIQPILDNRKMTRPQNKNPVKIVADNENSNKTSKSIHVQTDLDPELSELRKRIAAGIAAQKLLRQRLKQTTASRFQTTNIQKVFTPQKFKKTSGVSRRKTSNVQPKQSGVKTTLGDSANKKRLEGKFRYKIGHIHTGRAGSPSPVIAKRFHGDESVSESQQVQVAPSSVQMEKFETNIIGSRLRAFSAGPSALVDDENLIDNLRRTTKFENIHEQRDQPHNDSFELQSQPAFCRRCYKFWRNISTIKVNKSAIFQYCCTIGSNKGELFKTLRQTTSLQT